MQFVVPEIYIFWSRHSVAPVCDLGLRDFRVHRVVSLRV